MENETYPFCFCKNIIVPNNYIVGERANENVLFYDDLFF